MSKLGFIFLLWGILTRFSYGSKETSHCSSYQWQCADRSCIFLVGRCDNYPDCPDESDEKGCVSVVCNEGQRPCSSGECIDAKKFCDGVIDCKDAGDELAADCRGVILATTLKSEVVENNVSKDKHAQTQATARKQGIITTTTHVTPSVPVTFTSKRSTRPSWLPSGTNNKISRQNKTPPDIVPTSSIGKPVWEDIIITTKSPDKLVTFHPQHPPVIIVPIQIRANSQPQIKWPNWLQATTQKNNNPFRLSTPVPEETDVKEGQSAPITTIPYRYDIYNSTYQPTTVKAPCVIVEDRFEFCRRLYRGYFSHPDDCKQYIVCEWGNMHICTCPNHTHWDLHVITCVWEYTSPCITGTYDKPVVPDQKTPIATASSTTTKPSTTPLITGAKADAFMTTTPSFTTTGFIPPLVRLRALPATPAWLKELTQRTFLRPTEPQAPKYQSLLTRFFKAIPLEGVNQNVKINI